MRGKDAWYMGGCVSARITPAYAGKSGSIGKVVHLARDHPRLCGEKHALSACVRRVLGSPPPMRGKASVSYPFCVGIRITPAYAGKSMPAPPASMPARDHPRLCGEKFIGEMLRKIVEGSPPPMRGKVCTSSDLTVRGRITPAYAGKRPLERPLTTATKDHPRLCGEKSPSDGVSSTLTGSPPPMRGKVYGTTLHGQPHRITPAYAGKSGFHAITTDAVQDHPRLCGEKRPFFRKLCRS